MLMSMLAAAALAMLMGYKLIADSGNKNKTCDNNALWLFLFQNAMGDISTRYRNENYAVNILF